MGVRRNLRERQRGGGAGYPDGVNYLLLEDGTPAHTAFVNYAKHPENKFNVLMVATTPRLMAGDPIPAGNIEVRMVPIVTLLNR